MKKTVAIVFVLYFLAIRSSISTANEVKRSIFTRIKDIIEDIQEDIQGGVECLRSVVESPIIRRIVKRNALNHNINKRFIRELINKIIPLDHYINCGHFLAKKFFKILGVLKDIVIKRIRSKREDALDNFAIAQKVSSLYDNSVKRTIKELDIINVRLNTTESATDLPPNQIRDIRYLRFTVSNVRAFFREYEIIFNKNVSTTVFLRALQIIPRLKFSLRHLTWNVLSALKLDVNKDDLEHFSEVLTDYKDAQNLMTIVNSMTKISPLINAISLTGNNNNSSENVKRDEVIEVLEVIPSSLTCVKLVIKTIHYSELFFNRTDFTVIDFLENLHYLHDAIKCGKFVNKFVESFRELREDEVGTKLKNVLLIAVKNIENCLAKLLEYLDQFEEAPNTEISADQKILRDAVERILRNIENNSVPIDSETVENIFIDVIKVFVAVQNIITNWIDSSRIYENLQQLELNSNDFPFYHGSLTTLDPSLVILNSKLAQSLISFFNFVKESSM